MSEIPAQACIYTTADGSCNSRQELENIRAAVVQELFGLRKVEWEPYARPESIYINRGGGLLLQQLKDLQEKQEHMEKERREERESQKLVNEEVRKERESQKLVNEEVRKEQQSQKIVNEKLQKDLENETAFSKHLRRTAASARRRFFVQSKLRNGGEKPSFLDWAAIDEGNYAVHRGDLTTDGALFELGELSDREEFKRLYGVAASDAFSFECRFPSYYPPQ